MKGAAALLLVALVATGVHLATGFSTGAPVSRCPTLLPHHEDTKPRDDQSAFFVAAERVGGGRRVRVSVQSREGYMHKGFMLQAQDKGTRNSIGTFTVDNTKKHKTLKCGTGDDTVTHTDPSTKSESTFEWEPPAAYSGTAVFNATVVENFTTYWNNLTAEIPFGDGAATGAGISTTQQPRTTARTTTTAAPVTRPPPVPLKSNDVLYQDCKDTKACFGYPGSCDLKRSCSALITVRAVRNDEFEFELMLRPTSPQRYVAVGLSHDGFMGDDMVVQCLLDNNNQVQGFMSYNQGKSNTNAKPISLTNSSYTDGVIYCKFQLQSTNMVAGKQFVLANSKYYLLLAAGPVSSENTVRYHNLYQASGQSDSLSNVNGFSPASRLLLRLHGAFMVCAWIGAASIGIVLARYFKQTWTGSQLCGKDLWFAWHRMFMVLTWLLTIAGFVLIFIELKAWSSDENPHAILGVITTALAFFQPIFAAFRPHPDSRRRPIFNWFHWLVGNCAHILAIVSIFLAGQLNKAELPKWWIWILVGYVAFHVLLHLIFSVAGCVSERQNGKKINSFPMREMSNSRIPLASAERKQEAPHSCFRKFLLALYILGILGLTIVLIIIVVLAPIETRWNEFRAMISSDSS